MGLRSRESVVERPSVDREIPSVTGVRVLAFVFLASIDYWVAPTFLGVTNLAGTWAVLGLVLFAGWAAALGAWVFLPLARRIRPLVRTRSERWRFHALWTGALVLGLVATNTVLLGPPVESSPAVVWGWVTVYTPFGAWPSLTFYVGQVGLAGALNVEILAVLGGLAVLWASLLTLASESTRRSCAAGPVLPRRSKPRRGLAIVMWAPVGFVTGCSACTPLYLSLLGVFAPGAAAAGYAFLPFAPWIGFAGLLYLGSFALALVLLRHATDPRRFVPDSGTDPTGTP